MPAPRVKLNTESRARIFYEFVLGNHGFVSSDKGFSDKVKASGVTIDREVWERDAADRFPLDASKLEPKLDKKSRGTRAWVKCARDLISQALAKSETRFDPMEPHMPSSKLAEYDALLYGLAQTFCIDNSGPLIKAPYSDRGANKLLIGAALLADEYLDYDWHLQQSAPPPKVQHEMRKSTIVKVLLEKLEKDAGAKSWIELFSNQKLENQQGARRFRSPLVWYAIATLYLGYGYCVSQSSGRIAEALVLARYPSRKTAAFPLHRPTRTPMSWLEVAIAELTFQHQAPKGKDPKQWAHARMRKLVYESEDAFWENLKDEAKTSAADEADEEEGESDPYMEAAAAEARERKRQRQGEKMHEHYFSSMTAAQLRALRR